MKTRVLLIEDHTSVRAGVEHDLQQIDCETIDAVTEDDCIRVLAHGDADVVLLDAFTGEIDGLTVLQHIHTFYPDIPMIVVAGEESFIMGLPPSREETTDLRGNRQSGLESVIWEIEHFLDPLMTGTDGK